VLCQRQLASYRLLELTKQIYPENQTLACYLEVLSKMSLRIIKIAYSALEAKGKLEPTDMINLLLTETAKISDQLQRDYRHSQSLPQRIRILQEKNGSNTGKP
jgi:hypothetical protein